MAVNFEKKFCPEAIVKWYESPTNSHQLSMDAKMHLSAAGWGFFRVAKKTNGYLELRYKSPAGKVYNSLKTACRGYMEEFLSQGRGPETTGKLINVGAEGEENKSKQPRKRKISRRVQQAAVELSQPNFSDKKRFKNLKQEEEPTQIQNKPFVLRSIQSPSSRNPSSRNLVSWLIDNKAISLLTKVYYRDKTGKPLKKGRINPVGINCDCCFTTFTLTAFEAHSGSTNHRPAANIILDDGTGRSLSDFQRQVHDSKIKTSQVGSLEKTDDVCSVCLDGGHLICCDNCPSAFHAKCIGLNDVPEGDWFCLYCRCEVCGSGSRDGILLTCQQCERQFHAGCKQLDRQSDPESNEKWFCSRSCRTIFGGLQNLMGKQISVGNNLSWTLLKSRRRCSDTDTDSDIDLTQNVDGKLSLAVDVMHECFELSKEFYTGRDLVEDVIYSRVSKLKRVSFKGFYTVILEENDELVSVATVRVHGDRVAEMPLVATRFSHRRLGMCRVLIAELEKNLIKFGVEKLVLPALPDVLNTWTNKFGFSRMTVEERSRFLQFTFLDFQGTIRCQKLLKT